MSLKKKIGKFRSLLKAVFSFLPSTIVHNNRMHIEISFKNSNAGQPTDYRCQHCMH